MDAISSTEQAAAKKTNFQENVTLPTSCENDNDAVVQEDPPDNEDLFEGDVSILSTINKVSAIESLVLHGVQLAIAP